MTNSIKDIEEAKCIFIIGSNTFEAHPLIARRILKARSRGAIVIAADPRFTITARHADIYVPLRSGGDVALLNAMAHVIIRAGLMPYATRIFERILRLRTQAGGCPVENDGKLAIHAKPHAAFQTCERTANLMGGES